MPSPPPIQVAHLFPEISRELLALLRSLPAEAWHAPTSSSGRTVKDIASHLLDGSLRRLSMQRDHYPGVSGDNGPRANESLLQFLQRLNAEWEVATRRLSPAVLIELIAWADAEFAALFQSLDQDGPAIFPVAWAGEQTSRNWMDIARDYTEKWHHTQQIFVAAAVPSTITTQRLFRPCIATFMRALPFTFQEVNATPGTTVSVVVQGEAGGIWQIRRERDGWKLSYAPPQSPLNTVTQSPVSTATESPNSAVTLDQLTLWQLVTKRRTREQIRAQLPAIEIRGDVELGSHVLDMVAMMA